MKKALSILLAVLLLMACVPLGALSVSADTYGTTGDCVWTLNGTYLTISGNGAMENFKMYGSDVPWGTDITSVTIEDGVTAIGNWAFFNCDALPSVTIGNSVTSIGDHAFSTCDSLTSVTMGDNVTTIGRNAFSHCTALISVTIPHSVTRLDLHAFSYCTSLTMVTLPASVTSIGNSAFSNCTALTDVYYGGTLTQMLNVLVGDYNDHLYNATWYCLDDTVDCWGVIGACSWYLSDNTHLTISDEGAIEDCSCSSSLPWGREITSVTIEDGITAIGSYAFYDCISLTSVTIGNSVTSIGNHAFSACDSLTDVYYAGDESQRAAIFIDEYNDPLLNATWHYNYTPEPEVTPGDANGDGAVNNRDLALLQQYINKWEVTIDADAMDVNDDGAINNRDLALLQQYINKWDVTLS